MILVEYEGYLLVIIKDKIYLADSRAMFTNENHNEYEWFYWNIDIEPTCAVVYNGELWLGSKQGIFKIGKASENNKEISMEKDEEERYFIDGVTKQETGVESYKTATGKEILIEDGENNKGLEIKVKGSTNQATRSGKNLLDNTATTKISNGITFTVNSDGTVLADGTNDATANSNLIINRYDLSPGTYVLNGCPSGGAINTYRLVIQETGSYSVLGSVDIGNGSGEFTIDTTTKVQISIFIQKGLTINKLLFKPMLRKATIADDTYEQYGASPSPDYPSPIENVEGKNKLDYKIVSNTSNTVVSLIENGFNVNGMYAGKVIVDNLKKNTNYYLQYLTENIAGALKQVSIFAGDTQTNALKTFTNSIGGIFNTGENTKINIWFYANNKPTTTGEANFTNIQLEEGTVATPYVPYNSLEVKVGNKNLWDNTNVAQLYNVSYQNGIYTASDNDNKSVLQYKVQQFTDTSFIHGTQIDKTISGTGIYYFTGTKVANANLVRIGNNGASSEFIVKYSLDDIQVGEQFTIALEVTDTTIGASKFKNVMLLKGAVQNETYAEHQEQTVYFPLSEGQKLMEGSYLDDEGIHHIRKQVVFDGSDDEQWHNFRNDTLNRYYISLPNSVTNVGLSSHFALGVHADRNNEGNDLKFFIGGDVINFRNDSSTSINNWKTWLFKNPVTVEYELAEEEIVPYTTEQQEAWNKIESMKLYDGVNHIESTSEIDIKYNYIYKKPSIKNKSDIENKISSGEYQTIINNKRYFVFLEEELKSVRNDITDRLYIDTNKNIAKVMKRVDKLVLNGTEEWNVNTTHSNVFYTAKPKNMADNETNIFCTITDEFSKDLSGETYGILIDTNINIKIPKVKTVADLKEYLAKEPITIQYKATEEIKDIILLSKPSSYWTTCEDEFKYPQMQKTTNKRGCVADVIGEEIDVFCKTNKEQFEKIATHKNATGYAVNRIKKKKWKSIQLKFSSNKSFELFSCTLESYIGSYIKR